jgi:hypothetical protein
MKAYYKFILISAASFLLMGCGESQDDSTSSKTIENPVDTYMDSRVNAMDLAKESVKNSNIKVDEQNKEMEALEK